MGEEGAVPAAEAERVLQLRAAGQHRPAEAAGHGERLRHVTPGAAQHGLPAAERADHRVVGPDMDRPVVGEEHVRDAAQPGQGVLVPVGDRLVGDVAAGQHHRSAEVAEQQMVQRGVGQHHAQLPVARGHGRRERSGGRRRWPPAGSRRRPARQQDDGPPGAGQQARRQVVHLAQGPRTGQVRPPSPRTACPPGACAPAAAPRPSRWPRPPPGGSRPGPSPRAPLAAGQRGHGPGQRGRPGCCLPAARSQSCVPSAASSDSPGPQAGQHTGWAWNRRFAGSWYSASHAAHMAKPAIVVSGRS